jgi:Uma2 family endonuclease
MEIDAFLNTAETRPIVESDYLTERGKPMPSLNHAAVQANLIYEIKARYKSKYRIVSELSLSLETWPSVPDICILPHQSLDLRRDQIAVTEPPLCTIEIISPTQSLTELTDKARQYFEHGVRSCWLVLLPLSNVYVFSAPDTYQMFRAHENLRDTALDLELPLPEVFETELGKL